MDAVVLSRVIAEIEDQRIDIEACFERIEERAAAVNRAIPGTVEALAYQLHNYYNAAEDLLKLVAAAFENHIDDAAAGHKGLLGQMSHHIEGVRPPLILKSTRESLDALRRFRHFFRHGYGADLRLDGVLPTLTEARAVHGGLLNDIGDFTAGLRRQRDNAAPNTT